MKKQIVCLYCGSITNDDTGRCNGCGAAQFESTKRDFEIRRFGPFFYNGYIVWEATRYPISGRWDIATWYFYLGERLVETISVSRELLYEFVPGLDNEERFVDPMDFIWELFKVAQGEEEVLKVQTMNDGIPAEFEIRKVPTKKEAWATSLTKSDLHQAIIDGKRDFIGP